MDCLSSYTTKSKQYKCRALPLSTRLRQRIRRWHINWSSRRQLLTLDYRQLKDVGITPWQASEEAAKPFWKDQ